jgi:hypothetical protein
MRFACLVPSTVTETYRDAEGRERQLIYRKASGRHKVIIDVDGTPFPDAYVFGTVEEARACWREQRRALACRGFTKV